MAIVESIKGRDFARRIDDIVFYQLNGQIIARTVGAISKECLSKSPQYEAFRKNQSEFGLSAQLASSMQQALKPYLQHWKLPYTNSLLTGAFRKIIMLGKGKPGERGFDIQFSPLMAGEVFNPTKAFLCCGKPLKLDYETGKACMRISYCKLKKLFGTNCLPLRICIGVLALSDVEYGKNGYEPLQPDWHSKVIYNTRKIIDHWPDKGELRLKASFDEEVPNRVGLIGFVGVIPV